MNELIRVNLLHFYLIKLLLNKSIASTVHDATSSTSSLRARAPCCPAELKCREIRKGVSRHHSGTAEVEH